MPTQQKLNPFDKNKAVQLSLAALLGFAAMFGFATRVGASHQGRIEDLCAPCNHTVTGQWQSTATKRRILPATAPLIAPAVELTVSLAAWTASSLFCGVL